MLFFSTAVLGIVLLGYISKQDIMWKSLQRQAELLGYNLLIV